MKKPNLLSVVVILIFSGIACNVSIAQECSRYAKRYANSKESLSNSELVNFRECVNNEILSRKESQDVITISKQKKSNLGLSSKPASNLQPGISKLASALTEHGNIRAPVIVEYTTKKKCGDPRAYCVGPGPGVGGIVPVGPGPRSNEIDEILKNMNIEELLAGKTAVLISPGGMSGIDIQIPVSERVNTSKIMMMSVGSETLLAAPMVQEQ